MTTIIIQPNQTTVTVAPNQTDVTLKPAPTKVIEAGTPGPAGPPGSAGAQVESFVAATNLSALRVVAIADNQILYANSSNLDHAFAVVGLTLTAAIAGTLATVLLQGVTQDTGWNWSPNLPIFLGTAGMLTQTPPSAGFIMQVAQPLTPSKIKFFTFEPSYVNE